MIRMTAFRPCIVVAQGEAMLRRGLLFLLPIPTMLSSRKKAVLLHRARTTMVLLNFMDTSTSHRHLLTIQLEHPSMGPCHPSYYLEHTFHWGPLVCGLTRHPQYIIQGPLLLEEHRRRSRRHRFLLHHPPLYRTTIHRGSTTILAMECPWRPPLRCIVLKRHHRPFPLCHEPTLRRLPTKRTCRFRLNTSHSQCCTRIHPTSILPPRPILHNRMTGNMMMTQKTIVKRDTYKKVGMLRMVRCMLGLVSLLSLAFFCVVNRETMYGSRRPEALENYQQ